MNCFADRSVHGQNLTWCLDPLGSTLHMKIQVLTCLYGTQGIPACITNMKYRNANVTPKRQTVSTFKITSKPPLTTQKSQKCLSCSLISGGLFIFYLGMFPLGGPSTCFIKGKTVCNVSA